MLDAFLVGVVIGAVVMFSGAVFGYEIGRAARVSRPFLSVKRKPKEEDDTPQREYMDHRL